jgi:hypothetical protein
MASAAEKSIASHTSGIGIIFLAAFVWGIGNAVAGITAHKYLGADSIMPGIDIALANTVGGITFLLASSLALTKDSSESAVQVSPLPRGRTWIAGAMKGLNTCLFVLAVTHIPATDALVLESSYVLLSPLLAMLVGRKHVGLEAWATALLLLVGILLVQGVGGHGEKVDSTGVAYGLAAGLSYALFLFAWAPATARLRDAAAQVKATLALLSVALVTLLIGGELASLIGQRSVWVPFGQLSAVDTIVQLVNGVFVVGVVYLLITIGLQRLQATGRTANVAASLGLAFAVPFTLLAELVADRIAPTALQLLGVVVFMVGFVILRANAEEKPRATHAV